MPNKLIVPTGQVMLVQHQIGSRHRTLSLRFPLGVNVDLPVLFLDTRDWKRVNEGLYRLHGPVTIYLAPCKRAEYFCYLLLWDNEAGCFSCSCIERNSPAGGCLHCEMFTPLEEW